MGGLRPKSSALWGPRPPGLPRAWCHHRPSGCRARRHRLLHLPRGVAGWPQRPKDRLQISSPSGGRRPASGHLGHWLTLLCWHLQASVGWAVSLSAACQEEMEATRLAEQERKAEQRRRATVVVGDLQPLRDALPELLELQMGGQRRAAIRPRAAQLSRMSVAQRFQLLEEERTRFRELLASPAYRASPLQAIGRQLAQQMRLEGSGQS
ncbi:protein FAM207A isoform X7 [Phocoena sinus]|uniref:protein FAM207A isoform X7 n=1 Tax=Phocoena sinus TaxID=42100 RepID=UPI0013C50E27|nr:protein FAM207A isoform X7 [Phocoena sinus]